MSKPHTLTFTIAGVGTFVGAVRRVEAVDTPGVTGLTPEARVAALTPDDCTWEGNTLFGEFGRACGYVYATQRNLWNAVYWGALDDRLEPVNEPKEHHVNGDQYVGRGYSGAVYARLALVRYARDPETFHLENRHRSHGGLAGAEIGDLVTFRTEKGNEATGAVVGVDPSDAGYCHGLYAFPDDAQTEARRAAAKEASAGREIRHVRWGGEVPDPDRKPARFDWDAPLGAPVLDVAGVLHCPPPSSWLVWVRSGTTVWARRETPEKKR